MVVDVCQCKTRHEKEICKMRTKARHRSFKMDLFFKVCMNSITLHGISTDHSDFSFENLAHPSCRPQIDGILNRSLNFSGSNKQ